MSPNEVKDDADLDFDGADTPEQSEGGKANNKKAKSGKKNNAAKPEPDEDDDGDEDFGDEPEEGLEKEVKLKQPITSKNLPKVPVHISEIKDEQLKKLLKQNGSGHFPHIGFFSENGILFPHGFKTKHVLIGYRGNVVVNKCPKCGHQMSAEEAIKGFCSNERSKLNDGEPCDFNAVAELSAMTKEDIKKKFA